MAWKDWTRLRGTGWGWKCMCCGATYVVCQEQEIREGLEIQGQYRAKSRRNLYRQLCLWYRHSILTATITTFIRFISKKQRSTWRHTPINHTITTTATSDSLIQACNPGIHLILQQTATFIRFSATAIIYSILQQAQREIGQITLNFSLSQFRFPRRGLPWRHGIWKGGVVSWFQPSSSPKNARPSAG